MGPDEISEILEALSISESDGFGGLSAAWPDGSARVVVSGEGGARLGVATKDPGESSPWKASE